MDSSEAARIIASAVTVSDKIRALDAAGCPRAEIARLLGKRYQHVRNVLEADKLQRRPSPTIGAAEEGAPFIAAGEAQDAPDVEPRGRGVYRLAVRDDGSVMLPLEVREAFEVLEGGAVMAKLEGDEFKLVSAATALRRAQGGLRRHMPEGVSAVDELIAERRREAEREERDG